MTVSPALTTDAPRVDPAFEPRRASRLGQWRHWAVLVALVLGGAIVTYLRIPAAGRGSLYAEDGLLFVADWANTPGAGLLIEPYQGYQHLLPRMVAGVVVAVVPVSGWAVAMTTAACLIVGAVCALVFVLSGDVVAAVGARLGLALIPVLVPLAALEPIGNMANIHWYLLYLTPWLLLAAPRTTAAATALGVVAFVVAMTELQAAIFAPLALLVLLRRPAARLIVIGWAVGMAVQTASFLLTDRPRGDGATSFESAAQGYAINAVLSNVSRDNDAIGRLLSDHGWWPAVAGIAGFCVCAAIACAVGSTVVRVAAVALVTGSLASWFGTFYVNNAPPYDYSAYTGELLAQVPFVRWGTASAMFALALVPLAAGAMVARWPRWEAWSYAVTAGMAAVLLLGFSSPDNPRQVPGPGRDWSAAVRDAQSSCTGSVTQIPQQPAGWLVTVPCSVLQSTG